MTGFFLPWKCQAALKPMVILSYPPLFALMNVFAFYLIPFR